MGGAVLNVVLVLLALNFTDLGIFAIAGVSAAISVARNLLIIAPYVSRLLGKPWWTVHREMLVSLLSVGVSMGISLAVALVVSTGTWGTLVATIVFSCVASWAVVFRATFSAEQRRAYMGLAKARLLRK